MIDLDRLYPLNSPARLAVMAECDAAEAIVAALWDRPLVSDGPVYRLRLAERRAAEAVRDAIIERIWATP